MFDSTFQFQWELCHWFGWRRFGFFEIKTKTNKFKELTSINCEFFFFYRLSFNRFKCKNNRNTEIPKQYFPLTTVAMMSSFRFGWELCHWFGCCWLNFFLTKTTKELTSSNCEFLSPSQPF
jgi:hypothetical protein